MCMRRFLGLCLIVLGTANFAFAQKPDWKLVWEDNFDGSSLDYSNGKRVSCGGISMINYFKRSLCGIA